MDKPGILIVGYGHARDIETLLQCLGPKSGLPAAVVHIWDQPRPDIGHDPTLPGLIAHTAKRWAGTDWTVRLFQSAANVGYGCALNFAELILPPTCDPVIVLNPDTEVPEGQLTAWLELAKAAASKLHQPLGLAAPRLTNANGREQRSTYKFPNPLSYWLDHSLFGGALKELIKLLPHSTQSVRPSPDIPSDPLPVDWAMGAAWLVPRRAWTAIGGFDPAYFLYAEDTDFCWRLAQAGYQRVLLPDIHLIHQQGSPTGPQRGRQQILLFDGLRLYLKRTQRFPTRALVSLAILLDMGLRLILFGLPALVPGRIGALYRVRWSAAGITLWRTLLGR